MAEGRWKLWVRDANRELVAPIEQFTSATFKPVFNDLGAWLIKGIPMTSDAAVALVPGAGIIAVRNDDVVMSGPLLFPTLDWSDNGYVLDASGADDNLALWARLCFPAAPSLNLNAAYSDDRSGAAETVMRQYVDNNAGPSAAVARQWAGLALETDLGRGDAVSYSARLDTLGDVLVQLALAGGAWGFRVRQASDETALHFQVYDPEDRSSYVKFGAGMGNLKHYTYGRKAGALNHVIVGGGGEGTLRTFVELDNLDSQVLWGMRIEGFKDQRQTTDTTELAQAGQEELDTKSDQTNLTLEVINTDAVAYGTSYNLGDTVTVVVDDEGIAELVRSIQFDLTDKGETITPVVGTAGAVEAGTSEARAVDVLLARIRTLARNLSRIERST